MTARGVNCPNFPHVAGVPCDYCNLEPVATDYGACQTCADYHSDNLNGPTLIMERDGREISKHSKEYDFYLAQIAAAQPVTCDCPIYSDAPLAHMPTCSVRVAFLESRK